MGVETEDDLAVFFNTDEFAVAAQYTPPGGGVALSCALLRDGSDRSLGYGDAPVFSQGDTVVFRKSEVATPLKGGAFALLDEAGALTGETLTIIDEPQAPDGGRALWSCTVRSAGA